MFKINYIKCPHFDCVHDIHICNCSIHGKDLKDSCNLKQVEPNEDELFSENFEYPDDSLLLNGVQPGQSFEYVSSQYLSGFINYVKPIWGAILRRYKDNEEYNYQEAADKLLKHPHCPLEIIEDDVIVVGEGAGSSWLFWFDKDCSDCEIARSNYGFKSEDMINYVKEQSTKRFPIAVELTREHFRGWITC